MTSTICSSRSPSTTSRETSGSTFAAAAKPCRRFARPSSKRRSRCRRLTKPLLDVELPDGKRYQRKITREQYEQLIRPVIDRTVGPVRQAMKDAGLTAKQIDEAVLVGGSTRIPLVRKLVEEQFERTPHADLNPDEVVALGAAVQANILAVVRKPPRKCCCST